jgi:hypothetical protein
MVPLWFRDSQFLDIGEFWNGPPPATPICGSVQSTLAEHIRAATPKFDHKDQQCRRRAKALKVWFWPMSRLVKCLSWVNRVTLTARPSLPVFAD